MDNQKLAFFVDVDNTLLDNDHVKDEIKKSLIKVLGVEETADFWRHHDNFRSEKQLVDFPKIIHHYCKEKHSDTCELKVWNIFSSIEFKHALFPSSIPVLKHLKTIGKVILFTEGDSVYQKMKLENSGLASAADQTILCEHKLSELPKIVKKYKAYKMVFIDDRATSLDKIKEKYAQAFTIEVLQGHYSTVDHISHRQPDLKIDSIAKLLRLQRDLNIS